jgi:CTP:molybdopterin cytidylyltransferase MocA
MKPTLLVLAAGMGSRYGGLKQMDGLGPSGETIIDYSIYDAVKAGFGKVVYIVREIVACQRQADGGIDTQHAHTPSHGLLPAVSPVVAMQVEACQDDAQYDG